MVGFGRYEYRYDSGHGGESLVVGFSPRKAELSVYGLLGSAAANDSLPRLGRHRMGKGCLYLKRLEGLDESVLRDLIRAGVADCTTRWGVHPV